MQTGRVFIAVKLIQKTMVYPFDWGGKQLVTGIEFTQSSIKLAAMMEQLRSTRDIYCLLRMRGQRICVVDRKIIFKFLNQVKPPIVIAILAACFQEGDIVFTLLDHKKNHWQKLVVTKVEATPCDYGTMEASQRKDSEA